LKHFNELGLAESLLRAVAAEGYSQPTPIQAQVIPAMLEGRDVLGTAQTGTGKTAAFVLPLLHGLAELQARPAPRSCSGLILAPTRELAAQIADAVRTYGRFGRFSVAVIVGGVKPGPQIRAMAKGVDIVVATPGRLLDHMSSGAVRIDGAATVVLDEADQMLDLGFMPAIRRIMGRLPRNRQTVLLSATMPAQIRSLANDFLSDPKQIAVAPVSKPIELIDQKVILAERADKLRLLVDLLGGADVERTIIFTKTKRGADKVNVSLHKAGFSAAAIHGNKSQNQRERTLAAFRSGSVNILVATDIAARGIDIDGITHVVNFELPNVPEAYVHRIGRTARAGKSGIAISLCDGSERGLLRDIEKLIKMPIERQRLAAKDGAADGAPALDLVTLEAEPRRERSERGERAASDHQPGHKPGHQPGRKWRGGRNSRKPASGAKGGANGPHRGFAKQQPASRGKGKGQRRGDQAAGGAA